MNERILNLSPGRRVAEILRSTCEAMVEKYLSRVDAPGLK